MKDQLGDLGPLAIERVDLPGCAISLHIALPTDLERLLDAAENDPEQNLPYWSELWPSGVALAATIAKRPAALQNQRVLELGCGLGLTTICALRAGAAVLATDYSPEALELCRLNCQQETGIEPATLQINWRRENSLELVCGDSPYPIVLAADVLYERRDVKPLLSLVRTAVAPGGELWLAEPGRRHAARFVERLLAVGWTGERQVCSGPWPDPEDNKKGIVVTTHFLRRPPSQEWGTEAPLPPQWERGWG